MKEDEGITMIRYSIIRCVKCGRPIYPSNEHKCKKRSEADAR